MPIHVTMDRPESCRASSMKCFEHPTVCVIAILKVKQENNGGRRVDVKGGGGGGGGGG